MRIISIEKNKMKSISNLVRTAGMYVLLTATAFGADSAKIKDIADYLSHKPANERYTDVETNRSFPAHVWKGEAYDIKGSEVKYSKAYIVYANVDGLARIIFSMPIKNVLTNEIQNVQIIDDPDKYQKYGVVDRVYLINHNGGFHIIPKGDSMFKSSEIIFQRGVDFFHNAIPTKTQHN